MLLFWSCQTHFICTQLKQLIINLYEALIPSVLCIVYINFSLALQAVFYKIFDRADMPYANGIFEINYLIEL